VAKQDRNDARLRRHARIRKGLSGTAERPRLAVFRSNKYIYASVIDDSTGNTLLTASSLEGELKSKFEGKCNKEVAKEVGKLVATRAVEKGIKTVVFDRGGFIYHGKIKELADAAREAGLEF